MREQKNYGYDYVVRFENFKEMLSQAVEACGDKPAFKFKEHQEVREITYAQFLLDTQKLGTALCSLGAADGHIGMIGANSYYWINVYLTVLNSTGVYVPIDKELPPEDLLHVVGHSDCTVLFYSKSFDKFLRENADSMPKVRYFIGIGCERDVCPEDSRFLHYEDLISQGESLLEQGYREYLEMTPEPNKMKMLVYTSGTTGNAKGVMLSLKNLVSCVYYGLMVSTVYTVCLSVLPYHHTYEAVCGILVSLHKHATICINESLRAVSENLQLYKPDYIFLVPLFVETMYKKIWASAERSGKAGALRKLIKTSNAMRKVGIDARKKLFDSVRKQAFGGNLIKLVCGGAPIRSELSEFFDAIGISLINGYGITECSPLVSVNRDYFNDYRTVGVKLPCLDIRIDTPNEDGEGEICVRGDTVMLGYYKDPEATAEVLVDGWFHTGDYGFINNKEQLTITGRKKNLIVLSNGKNIYPEELEAKISTSEFISEVIVYGVKNESGEEISLCAEIYPCKEALESQGIENPTEMIKRDVKEACRSLPSYKQITKIVLRDSEFEKTTSKKIKRHSIGKTADIDPV